MLFLIFLIILFTIIMRIILNSRIAQNTDKPIAYAYLVLVANFIFAVIIGGISFLLFPSDYYDRNYDTIPAIIAFSFFCTINFIFVIPFYIKKYLRTSYYKTKDWDYFVIFFFFTFTSFACVIFYLFSFDGNYAEIMSTILCFAAFISPLIPMLICTYFRDK